MERSSATSYSDALPDSPDVSGRDSRIFFTGTYQVSLGVPYLAEMLNEDGAINIMIHRDNTSILEEEVRSLCSPP